MYLIGGWSSAPLDTVLMLDFSEEPLKWENQKKLKGDSKRLD